MNISQVKLGHLAGINRGASERCSEVFSGTGPEKTTIALLEVTIINQLCNLMQLTDEDRRKVLFKINGRCEADFVVTTSAAGQAKVAKKVHIKMLSTPVHLSDKLRLRSDCFLCYKLKVLACWNEAVVH